MREVILTFTIVSAILAHIVLRFATSDAYLIDAPDNIPVFATEISTLEVDPPLLKSTDKELTTTADIDDNTRKKEWKSILTMVEE